MWDMAARTASCTDLKSSHHMLGGEERGLLFPPRLSAERLMPGNRTKCTLQMARRAVGLMAAKTVLALTEEKASSSKIRAEGEVTVSG